jgi:cysteine desulfurase
VRACEGVWHNPSSVHKAGQGARHAVEVARGQVAELLSVRARECFFVSSGTEALDLAIRGSLATSRKAKDGGLPVLVTSKVEHAAIRELAEELEKQRAARVMWLKIGQGGVIDIDDATHVIEDACARVGGAVVAMQWANNETGVVQPVRAIGEVCRRLDARFIVDGTQWVGKMATSVMRGDGNAWCDMLVCSAHKFYGVKGCGVLWVRQGVRLRPTLVGTQELGMRGGTENVPAIMACGAAAEEAREFVMDEKRVRELAEMRDALEAGLVREVAVRAPHVRMRVNKPQQEWMMDGSERVAARLWNTTNIGFEKLEAEALLIAMSERGLMASAGAACSSGSLEPSPVLLAMGVESAFAHGSVRLSLGRETTREEVERACVVIGEVVGRVGRGI